MFFRRSLLAVTSAAVVLSVASPAWAHVDPDPEEAQAGSTLTVGFTVQHGCDGSPTVQLDMRLPDGIASAEPEPPEGWTGSVESNVITFVGGPLPDDQELTFRVLMTLPPTPDTTIYFPFVQRCEVGEIRWIAIPSDGSRSELDEPAPAMRLVGPVATTTTEATTTTQAPETTVATTVAATTTLSTVAPATTDSTEVAASTTTLVEDTGKDSSAGTFVFIGAIGAIAAVAAVLAVRARRQRR